MSKQTAAIVLMALFIAGCGGGPAATSTPSGTPAPTLAPTPTPLDVAAAFKTAYAAMKTGILTMSGQITLGAVQVSMTATNTVSGPDSSDTTTTTVGGVVSTTQHARVAGVRYVKAGNGPWLKDTSPDSSSQLGPELDRLAKLVTDAGTEQRGSATAHRLTTPTGSVISPAAFGLGGGAATRVEGSVTFFALDDGTPSGVAIQTTWSQPSGTTTVDGELSIDIAISQIGLTHLIKAPDHVWPVFASTSNAYRMAYPEDFSTTTVETMDWFDGPTGAIVGVGRDKITTATLNGIVSNEIALIKKSYKTTSVQNDATTLAGVKARLLTATGIDPNLKAKVVLYEVVAVRDKFVYYVFWIGPPESAAPDLVTFRQMLSTFAFG